MPSAKKPRSIVSRTDPLDNPYIASKLQKLQGVHEHTEKLMDKWHQENLEAEGKRPERVRVTARKPGPRTEEEKRKFYRARRVRPKANPQPEFFTLAEAAEQLEYKSDKSVWRLVKVGKLEAELRVHDGKRRWVIDRVDLNRYRLIEGNWLKRQEGPVPTLDGAKGRQLGHIIVYCEGGKESPARRPRYSLTVSIEEYWRFVCKKLKSKQEYETVRDEIRARLPGKPGKPRHFEIQYKFKAKEVDKTLMEIVKSVRPYRLRGEEWSKRQIMSLQFDALEHLKKNVLPSLRNADRDWISYFRQSVKNFYKDKYRKSKHPLNQLADQDLLSDAAALQNWKNSNRAELNDNPLSQLADQDLRDLQDSDLTELSKRLDPEQLLIFKEYLRKLKKGNKPAKRAASRR